VSEAEGEFGGLDELGEARLAEGRRLLAGLVSERDALAAAVETEMDEAERNDEGPLVEGPALRALEDWGEEDWAAGLPAEQARCLLFALAEWLSAGGEEYSWRADCFFWLTDRPLGLAVGDVRLLAALAEPGRNSGGYRPFEHVVDMVEELVRQRELGADALAGTVADQVLGWNVMVHHWLSADHVLRGAAASGDWDLRSDVAELRDKALELAGRPPALPALEGPVSRDDGDLPRAFRTAFLWLIHAADCRSRYSSWTCRGVRY